MTKRYVYGVYPTFVEAEEQADLLVTKGVPASSISLVANEVIAEQYTDRKYDHVTAAASEDNRSWFEKLFGLDEEPAHVEDVDYSAYYDSLSNDDVLLVVDNEYEGLLTGVNPVGEYHEDEVYHDEVHPNELHHDLQHDVVEDIPADEAHLSEEERIRLHEEKLRVDKERREVGEVEISKEVIEETQTIEVPVEREEIHIKHITPAEGHVEGDIDAFNEETIKIPISEEDIHVTKDTVVTGEVEIGKTVHTDYEQVTETTRREELQVHDEDALVDGAPLTEEERIRREEDGLL